MKKGEKMNSKLLAAGGSNKKCHTPSVSSLFRAWSKNSKELRFENKLELFTRYDLINWRTRRGWTQPDMAEWCGHKLRWVQKLEYGETEIPKWLVRLIFLDGRK